MPTFPAKSGGIPDLLVHSPRNTASGLRLRCSHRPHQRPTKFSQQILARLVLGRNMPSSCSPGSTKHSGAPVSRIGSLEGRRAASTLQAARWPIARPNECFCPFGLHTFCVLSFTSYQVGVATTCGFPNGALSTGVENAFGRWK